MTAGWCSRTVRAAVFAAVCVLLAATGHVLMSGVPVPWWAMVAGAAATGGTALWAAGRERGPLPVGSATVAAQAALHASFSLAQAVARPGPPGSGSLGRRWLDHLLCAPAGPAPAPAHSMDHGTAAAHAVHPAGHLDALGTSAHMDHGTGGMSSAGMLAAHLLAALLCGLWLAHGERAAFRILRALAARFLAPLRPLLRLPAPPDRPRVRARRTGPARVPHRLLLTRAITYRGPPAGVAVA
ncbi:hypothetical protein ACLGIH_03750 [Streptomyces sp. HMX87]|uniref:hypothetical protein n=1 Tax=Streptomyces sp. HMX87 TaxID=3390849 RepID=UPI003A8B0C50